MPFPTGESRRSLADALEQAQKLAASVKSIATNYRTQMAAGPVDARLVLATLEAFRERRAKLSQIATVPGIGAYAQDQLGDDTLDIGAEFAGMVQAMQQAESWIVTNLPKDGDGYLLLAQLGGDGSLTYRVFGSAATAPLRTLLDAVIASID